MFEFAFSFIKNNAFLLFPFFCCFFIDFRLFSKKEYEKLFVSFFLQFFLCFFLYFFQEILLFDLLLSCTFFLLFFGFLFYFLDLLSNFIDFNVFFEFYLNLIVFVILLFFSFVSRFGSFNLLFSILGLFVFSLLRLFYLYWRIVLDDKLSIYKSSGFLVQWTYFWSCSTINLIFFIFVLFFWNFDYYLFIKILQLLDIYSIFSIFLGMFGFPYFLYFCDYVVDFVFSKLFSVASGYSSRARTFRSSLKWVVRIIFGLCYFSVMYVNFSTVSWNLSVLLGLGTLGFKGVIDDFINGICVLIEDSINIGEFIHVADVSGTVEDVSLRVIKLRNFDGSLYVVPFRKVEIIKNRSKDFVYIVFDLILDLNLDSALIVNWISDAFILFKSSEEASTFASSLLGDLEIVGITSVTAVGVVYQARLKISPCNTRFIKAVYLRCLKELAKERSIKFGFEHVILSKSKII